MKTDRHHERIHAVLDGKEDPSSCTPEEQALLARYQQTLQRLEGSRVVPPPDLTARIMSAVQVPRRATFREWITWRLPQRHQWAIPALAGALAMLIILSGIWVFLPAPADDRVRVHFQVHAPTAESVELVGDFNHWTPGSIQLQGPDATGHWTVDMELPEGRYEYLFLVDGKSWMQDPRAPLHRPDGFGQENAVVNVFQERS